MSFRKPVCTFLAVGAGAMLLAGPASAGTTSLYAANLNSGNVSQYDVATPSGLLSPKSPATVAAGMNATNVATTPAGTSAYVANQHGPTGTVSQYDITAGNGLLGPKTPASVGTSGGNTFDVAVSPNGLSAYVTNGSGNNINQYDIGAGGALTPKSPAAVDNGMSTNPNAIVVSPNGNHVYVANNNGTITIYDVSAVDGDLSTNAESPVTTTAPSAVDLAIHPDGQSLYVVSGTGIGGDIVSQYDVDTASGKLTPKTTPTVAIGSGNNPRGITVSPDGLNAYVTLLDGDSLNQYDIDGSGNLVAESPLNCCGGDGPRGVVVSPDGNSVYVARSNTDVIAQYDRNGDGLLSAKVPGTVPAGDLPFGLAITIPPDAPAQPSPPAPPAGGGEQPGAETPLAGDTDAPNTTITKGPKDRSKNRQAGFEFSSDDPSATFECRLDDEAFVPCASPKAYKVSRGKHTFEVRARDQAGNVDPTPASDSWTVTKKKKEKKD